jgi:LasA protease
MKPYLRLNITRMLYLLICASLLTGCVQTTPFQLNVTPELQPLPTSTQVPPTPIPTRPIYGPATLVDYTAQDGDTLQSLAAHFNTTVREILEANPLIQKSISTLQSGIAMKIPIYYKALWGSQFQIIPDTLFVNGPAQIGFNASTFVDGYPGWLKRYSVLAGDATRRGGELIDYVAQTFSVSPKLLLALVEYQIGALSKKDLSPDIATYPLGYEDQFHKGFYLQLVWAANILNNGYYSWRNGELDTITRLDGSIEVPDPWQNAATVAMQNYFSMKLSLADYSTAISGEGFFKVYSDLFGDPWQSVQSNIPGNLQQPDLYLPFATGKTWAFTGGPHAAWGSGEPFAALDFAPPGVVGGCSPSGEFVTAVADGQIVRTEPAVVILDLDQDGDERTGWVVLYLHLGLNDMVRPGVLVKAGDPIGHPSCEGGTATGTHIHIARKYNGEWIDAVGAVPFNLEGWIAKESKTVYLGTLKRFGKTVVACTCSSPDTFITAGKK